MPRRRSKEIKLARGLVLPEDAVTQTFGVLARKGAGKTYCSQKLAEGMLDAGAQIVALDPIGNWWSLRLAADGKSPGYDIPVFGGLRGDIPLQSTAGEFVADVVVDTGTSVVLDVSQFRKGERKRFVADFCERLFMRRKADPSPTHVFLEEAQAFVPERTARDDARMVGAVEDIVRLGRNFGLGATMISQRPQSVNKEVFNMTECLIMLQISGPHERKAVERWVIHKGVEGDLKSWLKDLPSLKIGEAFVWSPQWLDVFKRVKISPKTTFDASATPKLGARKRERKLHPLDLAKIQTAMKTVVEESHANNPAHLKKEIARLTRELTKASTGGSRGRSSGDPERAAPLREEIAQLRTSLKAANRQLSQATKAHAGQWANARKRLQALERELVALKAVLEADGPQFEGVEAPTPTPTPRATPAARSSPEPHRASGTNGTSLGAGAKWRVLQVLLQYPDGVTPQKVRFLAKIAAKSSTLGVALSELRRDGMEAKTGSQTLKATPLAFETYGAQVEPLPSGEELRDYWLGKVGPASAAGRVLSLAYERWPNTLSHPELREGAGISDNSSTLGVALADLRRLELVDKNGRDPATGLPSVKALDHLFDS